ncbi:MAG TPA: AAA family ATPase, partial [Rikenellaceae bacterium]|nr:AAA family ATPase [Rikenellaceae bacterium]
GELETEWKKHPVLHFDMSTAKHMSESQLLSELNIKLLDYERIYGKVAAETEINQRFAGLVQRAVAQTGEKAVVIIDEYDA